MVKYRSIAHLPNKKVYKLMSGRASRKNRARPGAPSLNATPASSYLCNQLLEIGLSMLESNDSRAESISILLGKLRDHLSGDQLYLFWLITVGDQYDPVYARLYVRSELIDALFRGPSDCVLYGGVTP